MPSLSDLPAELHLRILEYLEDPIDIFCLHLMDRRFYLYTSPTFYPVPRRVPAWPEVSQNFHGRIHPRGHRWTVDVSDWSRSEVAQECLDLLLYDTVTMHHMLHLRLALPHARTALSNWIGTPWPMFQIAACEAAREGLTSFLELLLTQANAPLVSTTDREIPTPLHWAIAAGHEDTALMIARTQRLPVNALADGDHMTALRLPVRGHHVRLVNVLLCHGASILGRHHNGYQGAGSSWELFTAATGSGNRKGCCQRVLCVLLLANRPGIRRVYINEGAPQIQDPAFKKLVAGKRGHFPNSRLVEGDTLLDAIARTGKRRDCGPECDVWIDEVQWLQDSGSSSGHVVKEHMTWEDILDSLAYLGAGLGERIPVAVEDEEDLWAVGDRLG